MCGRYLIVLYYQHGRAQRRIDVQKRQQELEQIKARYGMQDDDASA